MIREMRDEDWGTVAEIYKQGLEEGISTFNTEWILSSKRYCLPLA